MNQNDQNHQSGPDDRNPSGGRPGGDAQRQRPAAREEPELRDEDDNIPNGGADPSRDDPLNDRQTVRPEDQSGG